MKRLANIVGGWVEMQNLRDRGKEDNKHREMTQIKVKQIAGSSSNYKMLGVLKSNLSYVVGKRMHYTAFLCFLPNLGVTNIFFSLWKRTGYYWCAQLKPLPIKKGKSTAPLCLPQSLQGCWTKQKHKNDAVNKVLLFVLTQIISQTLFKLQLYQQGWRDGRELCMLPKKM